MGWSTYPPCRAKNGLGSHSLSELLSLSLPIRPPSKGSEPLSVVEEVTVLGMAVYPVPNTHLGLKSEHSFPGAKLHSFGVMVLKSSCLCILRLIDTPPLGLGDFPLNLCSVPAQWPWSACLLTGKPCSGLGSGMGGRQLSCFPGETVRKETSILHRWEKCQAASVTVKWGFKSTSDSRTFFNCCL